MTQVKLPSKLIQEVRTIIDTNPLYQYLELSSNTEYVKEAVQEFVRSKGNLFRQTIKEEVTTIFRKDVDEILKVIIERQDHERQKNSG